MKDDLRPSTIFGDRPFDAKHTDPRNIPDTGFVPLPYDSGERLVWIRLFEVDKGGRTAYGRRDLYFRNPPANGPLFSEMFACI